MIRVIDRVERHVAKEVLLLALEFDPKFRLIRCLQQHRSTEAFNPSAEFRPVLVERYLHRTGHERADSPEARLRPLDT